MSTLPEHVLDQHRDRIAAFVRRARRVEAHSLLEDLQQFHVWAQGTSTLGPVDGTMALTQDVPPEEAFESLASRCRPFLLQGEVIHWTAVCGSLRAFLNGHEQLGPLRVSIRDSWATAASPKPTTGFAMLLPEEAEADAVWFWTLAESWLYGDLVHADPKAQDKARSHTLNSRYCAAVLLYGQVAMHVVATLNLVREACGAGLFEVDEECFAEPVAVDVPMQFPVVAYAHGPVGTPTQRLLDVLDEEDQ